jgi:hypothetical protein
MSPLLDSRWASGAACLTDNTKHATHWATSIHPKCVAQLNIYVQGEPDKHRIFPGSWVWRYLTGLSIADTSWSLKSWSPRLPCLPLYTTDNCHENCVFMSSVTIGHCGSGSLPKSEH